VQARVEPTSTGIGSSSGRSISGVSAAAVGTNAAAAAENPGSKAGAEICSEPNPDGWNSLAVTPSWLNLQPHPTAMRCRGIQQAAAASSIGMPLH